MKFKHNIEKDKIEEIKPGEEQDGTLKIKPKEVRSEDESMGFEQMRPFE